MLYFLFRNPTRRRDGEATTAFEAINITRVKYSNYYRKWVEKMTTRNTRFPEAGRLGGKMLLKVGVREKMKESRNFSRNANSKRERRERNL